MKRLFLPLVVVALAFNILPTARAQAEITLLAPGPIKTALDKGIAGFEAKSNSKVRVTYGGGVPTRNQVASGQGLDVDLLFAPFPEVLKTGNIVRGSATVVARVRLALAMKKGVPSPDISSAAAVKKLLLNAKSIATVDPAQGSVGGVALAALAKLGIADEVKPKLKFFQGGGGVQDAVAKGEIEIALGPYMSDMNNPGLNVVGPLPVGASTPVDITGFLSPALKDQKTAKALLAYLRSREVDSIWDAAKIYPVH